MTVYIGMLNMEL